MAEVPFQFRWATMPQGSPSRKLVRSLNTSMRQLANDFEARLQMADARGRTTTVVTTIGTAVGTALKVSPDTMGLRIMRSSAHTYEIRLNDNGSGTPEDATKMSWALVIGDPADDVFRLNQRPVNQGWRQLWGVNQYGTLEVIDRGANGPAFSSVSTNAVNAQFRRDASNRLDVKVDAAGGVTLAAVGTSPSFTFSGGTVAFVTLTTSSTLFVNATAAYGRLGQKLETNSSADYGGMAISTWSATAVHGPLLDLSRSKSNTVGTHAVVASGDLLAAIVFRGSDGTAFRDGAQIFAEVDGAPGASDMPGRLIFATTADGAASVTERMRIDSAGLVTFASAPTATAYKVGGTQVVGAQGAAVADATDAASAITQLNLLLARVRSHGLLAT